MFMERSIPRSSQARTQEWSQVVPSENMFVGVYQPYCCRRARDSNYPTVYRILQSSVGKGGPTALSWLPKVQCCRAAIMCRLVYAGGVVKKNQKIWYLATTLGQQQQLCTGATIVDRRPDRGGTETSQDPR